MMSTASHGASCAAALPLPASAGLSARAGPHGHSLSAAPPARPATGLDTAAGAAVDELERLWGAVLAEARRDPSVSPASFSTWLQGTRLLAITDGVCIVGVPHAFAQMRLERSLRPAIEGALRRCTGQAPVAVRFVVARTGGGPGASLFRRAGRRAAPLTRDEAEAPPDHAPEPALEPRYTFDRLVTGPSNQLAVAAARAVAAQPGFAYNPLVICGASGLGKTHLLHAIGHEARRRRPEARIVLATGARFGEELAAHLRAGTLGAFRARYYSADVLLLDDLQSLPAVPPGAAEAAPPVREADAQRELVQLVAALCQAGRQVVVTANRPPAALATLSAALRARLQLGLVTELTEPGGDERLAILRRWAADLTPPPPLPVLELIAQRVRGNVPAVLGALQRVLAAAALARLPLTPEHAAAALAPVLGRASMRRPRVSPEQVLAAVSRYYGIGVEVLRSRRRHRATVEARQVAMYLLREETNVSLSEAGGYLGGRDHSTVLHGYARIAARLQQDARLREELEQLRRGLRGDGEWAAGGEWSAAAAH
jgi:chromosomal replication initiator protein